MAYYELTKETRMNFLKATEHMAEIFAEDILEWTDEEVMKELTNLEIIMESDEAKSVYMSDLIYDAIESLKDECIRRFNESVKSEK